jgi:hypothetical protein
MYRYLALCALYFEAENYKAAQRVAIAGLAIEGYYFEQDHISRRLEYYLAECRPI